MKKKILFTVLFSAAVVASFQLGAEHVKVYLVQYR